MSIEPLPGGGTIITGPDIHWFAERALYSALKLEEKGLKLSRGKSAFAIVKARYGLKGSKAKVREEFGKMIEVKWGRKISE